MKIKELVVKYFNWVVEDFKQYYYSPNRGGPLSLIITVLVLALLYELISHLIKFLANL